MSSDKKTHLVVLQHGMWGSVDHMKHIENTLVKKWGDRIYVLNAKSNQVNLTYDGVDICGRRLAEEILEKYDELKEKDIVITKFSILGYSHGGLTARYAIGILYSQDFFKKVEPVSFTTFATPHLGVRQPYTTTFSRIFNSVTPHVLARSGQHMTFSDESDSQGRPLLLIMTDPASIFFKALALFQRRSVYANIVADRSVPYWTAAFVNVDPFHDLTMIDIEYDSEYPCMVRSHKGRTTPLESSSISSRILHNGPIYLAIGILGPIWITFALSMMSIQSYRSHHRVSSMSLPSTLDKVVDDAIVVPAFDAFNAVPEDIINDDERLPLSLSDTQKKAMENLNKLKWEKNIVHCKKSLNAHASIVVRNNRFDNEDGRIAVKHYVELLKV